MGVAAIRARVEAWFPRLATSRWRASRTRPRGITEETENIDTRGPVGRQFAPSGAYPLFVRDASAGPPFSEVEK